MSTKPRKQLGSDERPLIPKPTSSAALPPTRSPPPKPSQTVPPTGDWVFEFLRL